MRPAAGRLVVVLSLLVLVACRDGGGAATPTRVPGSTSLVAPVRPSLPPASEAVEVEAGHDAWVDVAVANLWAEPDQARPLDTPSLTRPVDIDAWLAAMTVDDRRWLVDRLVTQALYGDQVTVVEIVGGWAKVVVLRQPSSLDPRGYPGWLPTAQLSAAPSRAPKDLTRGDAIVARPTAPLRDASRPGHVRIDLSFNTRLPVLYRDQTGVTVGTPGGDMGLLSYAEVEITDAGHRAPTGDDVVRSAQMFTGVDYLWGGTSGAGFDCSGLTSAVYAAHGVVIPRDAHDQAAEGTPVDRADLRPGDLLFFATGADRNSIHHVGMYVGDGRMIQAPATGRSVETVSIDQPGLASSFWGARRYLQP